LLENKIREEVFQDETFPQGDKISARFYRFLSDPKNGVGHFKLEDGVEKARGCEMGKTSSEFQVCWERL
jgi:hypothetical protein